MVDFYICRNLLYAIILACKLQFFATNLLFILYCTITLSRIYCHVRSFLLYSTQEDQKMHYDFKRLRGEGNSTKFC